MHQVTGPVLRIINAVVRDRGMYICSAENPGGVAQASAIVEVERESTAPFSPAAGIFLQNVKFLFERSGATCSRVVSSIQADDRARRQCSVPVSHHGRYPNAQNQMVPRRRTAHGRQC